MEDLGKMFVEQVVPQLITALGLLLVAAVGVLKSRTGRAIADKFQSGALKSSLEWGANLAYELVLAAEQTVIAQVKLALADGHITEEEYKKGLQEVKKEVLEKLKAQTLGRFLSAGAAKTVEEAAGLCSDLVESAVKKSKVLDPPKPSPVG